jgi:hypothetical protein
LSFHARELSIVAAVESRRSCLALLRAFGLEAKSAPDFLLDNRLVAGNVNHHKFAINRA